MTTFKEKLKTLLRDKNPEFWSLLPEATLKESDFTELLTYSNLRKKALTQLPAMQPWKELRIALVGGYSLFPLSELIEQYLSAYQIKVEIFKGDFDNYYSEILEENSELYSFKPDAVLILPSGLRCRYLGSLLDPLEQQKQAAEAIIKELSNLAQKVSTLAKCEVFLGNFLPVTRCDLGKLRHQKLGGDYAFRNWVNMHLGLSLPNKIHILDLDFLATQLGSLRSEDPKAWFESKQIGSPALLMAIAKNFAHKIHRLKTPAKKVLVTDLDDSVWGGVIGDDGMEGIEIGSTSPRGEAYQNFQRYILGLQKNGFLLGVCSKNDYEKAIEPFESHPEMVLRKENIVSFKANWSPKSDNIKQMAQELNLGLDSFVFIDDNPAEIEIVRSFLPQVSTILLSGDPAHYPALLQDSGYFELNALTEEDTLRTQQYQSEVQFNKELELSTDMDSFLNSLNMEAVISEFKDIDIPRITQLTNKSNQFNLTTKRRTENEMREIMKSEQHVAFSVRLKDKLADHGLISVVIGEKVNDTMMVDTWLMSCRVLRRQVEEEIINEITRLAKEKGCKSVTGVFLPTAKNQMVAELYPKFGFKSVVDKPSFYVKDLEGHESHPTKIKVIRRAYERN